MNLFPENSAAESRLVTSDMDFKAIVDSSPYPIFIHRGGVVKYANLMSKKMIHAGTDEDLKGELLANYVHPEDHYKIQEAIDRVHSSELGDVIEFRMVDRDGNIRTIESRSVGISFGGELCRLVHVYNYNEIRLAQEEIQEKDVLLNKLIEILPDSLVVVNSVTRQQLFNSKSFVKHLGYSAEDYSPGDEFDLISEKIHPDDRTKLAMAREFVNNPENSGKLYSTEYRILNKANEWRWILGRSCSLKAADDGVGMINFGIAQDITEIKKNQNELLNYQVFQEKINSTSPALVTIFDIISLTSVYRSQDMKVWFNYSENNFPEKTIELVHPEYREEAIAALHKVAELKDGEIFTTVYPFVTGDNNLKFILTRSTPFQRDDDGKVTHILMAHSDVTDLKEIESRLDKSEETRKAILFAIPDMVGIVTKDGLISDFYPGEAVRSRVRPEDIIGKNLRDVIDASNFDNMSELISKTIAENKLHYFNYERRFDDTTHFFEMRISPFLNNEVILLTRDISDQKLTQNKLDHYNQELYKKNQELERYITSNSELEKFAYIASHDLREPLRSLTGFAQLLQKRNIGKLTKESEEFIENIIQGAQRMNTLISGLLEYSRITSTGKPFAHVNLQDLIRKVRSDLKISIEENKADLIIFDLPEIYCDELQMRQLFQNLISNAIKFRSERDPIIKISAEKTDRFWQFKVEDNGIGIDMKFKDQVFQIFSRLHAQDKYQGSGIGLSVCRKIIERHGGQIWLESTPGKGTAIFFTILT